MSYFFGLFTSTFESDPHSIPVSTRCTLETCM
uniref:Uncharacterized protein n=1 Tax=Anguilla anguilla TaxID=7936 RepID=A0A0E9PCB0_ANGAN